MIEGLKHYGSEMYFFYSDHTLVTRSLFFLLSNSR